MFQIFNIYSSGIANTHKPYRGCQITSL
eukprot:UN16364